MREKNHSGTGTLLGIFVLAAVLCLDPGGPARTGIARAQLSDGARASVLTVWPGEALYSAFGHTAIRIHDPELGYDRLYNYGTFDFETEGFYLEFLRGRLDYMLSRTPTLAHLRLYRRRGRSVLEQHLALTPAQVDSLYRFLEWNYRPEHRTYRYDFFFDNCATRPRDALERVLGEALEFPRSGDSLISFRRHLDPYLRDRPFVRTGVDLILGRPADALARPYQTTFLPVELKERLTEAHLAEAGRTRALVTGVDTLHWSGRSFPPERAYPWLTGLLWLLAGGALAATVRGIAGEAGRSASEGPGPRWIRLLDGLLFGATGAAGLIVLLLWTATDHAVTGPNWNLLWAWPTHLVAAPVLWMADSAETGLLAPGARGGLQTGLRIYLAGTVLALAVTFAGWWWWPQELPPAIVPLLLALLLRGIDRLRGDRLPNDLGAGQAA